jgi:hypothetical protein
MFLPHPWSNSSLPSNTTIPRNSSIYPSTGIANASASMSTSAAPKDVTPTTASFVAHQPATSLPPTMTTTVSAVPPTDCENNLKNHLPCSPIPGYTNTWVLSSTTSTQWSSLGDFSVKPICAESSCKTTSLPQTGISEQTPTLFWI